MTYTQATVEGFAKSCMVYPHRACPGGCDGLRGSDGAAGCQCLRAPPSMVVALPPGEDIERLRAQWHEARDISAVAVVMEEAASDSITRTVHEAALDAVYAERNTLVALLARLFRSGRKRTAIEGWDPAWHNCVYIDLPTGQASWHYHDRDAHLFDGLPQYEREWDGHTTAEKYAQIEALAKSL